MIRVIVLYALVTSSILWAQATTAVLQEIVIPEYKEGVLKSLMSGKQAFYKGSVVDIQNAKLELYGKGVMTIKSPFCRYNSVKKCVTSDASILMVDQQMKVTGKGYFIDLVSKDIEIFSHLEIELEKAEMEKVK